MIQRETFAVACAAIYVILCIQAYQNNKKRTTNDVAQAGSYSHGSSYSNISAMKHDMFKQTTIDLLPRLLILGIPALLASDSGVLSLDEVITFQDLKGFKNSIIGGSILTVLGYFMFYQIVQPDYVNKLPFF